MRNQTNHFTVNSGDTVSEVVGIEGARAIGLQVPANMEAVDLFLQGGFDTTSGSFVRLESGVSSADYTWPVASATGSRGRDVTAVVAAFPKMRVELGGAVADVRTLTAVMKF